MPAISRDVQKTAGRHAMLAALAVAAAAAGIILYFFAAPDFLNSQDACLAAHAADYGVTTQQLRSDVSRQPELVVALSSCSGMAP